MATVADLILLLDGKLYAHIDALDTTGHTGEDKKIQALDSGKEKVWQLLVASGKQFRDNWFGKTGAFSFSAGVNSDALPSDFHSLLSAESTSAIMKASTWHKDTWQNKRAQSGNQAVGDQEIFYYLVSGETLYIAPKPAGTLSGTVHYVQKLTTWNATSDNVDGVPAAYHDAIANYAAASILAGVRDFEAANFYLGLWRDDQQMISGSGAARNLGDDVSAPAFDLQR